MYRRISTVVTNFKDVSKLSEIEIASLARRDGIDIAIDLSGLTKTEDRRSLHIGLHRYK